MSFQILLSDDEGNTICYVAAVSLGVVPTCILTLVFSFMTASLIFLLNSLYKHQFAFFGVVYSGTY